MYIYNLFGSPPRRLSSHRKCGCDIHTYIKYYTRGRAKVYRTAEQRMIFAQIYIKHTRRPTHAELSLSTIYKRNTHTQQKKKWRDSLARAINHICMYNIYCVCVCEFSKSSYGLRYPPPPVWVCSPYVKIIIERTRDSAYVVLCALLLLDAVYCLNSRILTYIHTCAYTRSWYVCRKYAHTHMDNIFCA